MVNHIDDIDERLRDYASRWVASQPPPLSVDTAVFTRLASAHRQRRIAVFAAAFAIVLLAAGLAVSGTLTSRPSPPHGSSRPSPTARDVIAWAALSPTGVQIPTTTAPESPDPSRAAGLPQCHVANLSVSSNMVGAMGNRVITVTLTSATPCRLAGYPSVAALDPSGRNLAVPTYPPITPADGYTGPVAVSDSTPAGFFIQWTPQFCALVPINIAKLRITLPDNRGGFTVNGFGPSECVDSPAPSSPTPFEIGPIQPRDYIPAREATVFNDVTVSLAVPRVGVSPGDTLKFTVSLHAPALHDIPLDPCPDYTIWLKEYPPDTVSYALNCAAVPYRDPAGNPLLPAGSTVSFAMQLLLPPAGVAPPGTTLILGWNLNTRETTASTILLRVV
jgi:uncharacterized protein DUF4232